MEDEITSYLASASALSATAADGPLKLKPGAVVGGYRVLAFLGRGASGEVWKVRDDALNCDLALKLFSPKEPCAREDCAKLRCQFVKEARCLAQFRHPNIARVHALSEEGDSPYFTMDFLHPLVRPVPRRLARRIVADVLSALDELHARGIVHRDVKPSNVLLDDRGNAVLADFGVVQIGDGETAAKVRSDEDVIATHSDKHPLVAGTPEFSAPEQFVGMAATPASDLHAVGRLSLWLFDGVPPLSWRWFVMRATNSSPAMRYRTAKSMSTALFVLAFLEYASIFIAAVVASSAIVLVALLCKPAEPLDLFESAEIAETNMVCRYDFLGTSQRQRGRVITLRDGREYTTGSLLGRVTYAESGYDEKLQTKTMREVREPIVIQGRGSLHADRVAFAEVHLMPGVRLVTSGEYPGFTRRIPYGDPKCPRSRYEPCPVRPPPDASATNRSQTVYATYVVEKGAELVFSDNKEYPPSLIECR